MTEELKFDLGTGKTADAVYAALRDGIVSGALREGERLNEESLASQFGVSRTPIRNVCSVSRQASWFAAFHIAAWSSAG